MRFYIEGANKKVQPKGAIKKGNSKRDFFFGPILVLPPIRRVVLVLVLASHMRVYSKQPGASYSFFFILLMGQANLTRFLSGTKVKTP
jgi:hypothetical protein